MPEMAIAIAVVQSNLIQLELLVRSATLLNPLQAYTRFLISYLNGDQDEMQKIISTWPASATGKDECLSQLLKCCAALRLSVRQVQVDKTLVQDLESLASKQLPLWQGEVAFVLGKAWEILNDFNAALNWYQVSEQQLLVGGAERKAVKALQCAVAAKTKINPSLRMVYELRHLILRAEKAECLDVTAVCHLNLAREYQKVSALRPARVEINKAISLLAASQPASLDYYLALSQRASILFEMGLREAALCDFEEASCTSFHEVSGALAVLKETFLQDTQESFSVSSAQAKPYYLPTWTERRLSPDATTLKTGGRSKEANLENQLIRILAEAPKTRLELAQLLYHEVAGDLFAKQDRAKQLIYRIRKKTSNLIGYDDGRYFLIGDAAH